MVEFEKPGWGKVVLVGLAFLAVILIIVCVDAVLTGMDKDEFCENITGMTKYPVCERNVHKMCHGESNATLFLDCGG